MDITSKLQLETRCVLHVESYLLFYLTLIKKDEKIFLAVIPKIQWCGPGSWIRCLFDPGIRDVKKSGSGSGMNNPDHISKSLETIFWVKIPYLILWCGFGIRNGKNSDPGQKIFGSEIRDKHPGSATLPRKMDLTSRSVKRYGTVYVEFGGTDTVISSLKLYLFA
jgi:hypothetical protein